MKTALVTGASGGIGSAISKQLYDEDYNLALVYNKDFQSAADLAENLPGAKIYQCDMCNFENVRNLYAAVIEDFGNIDVVVNNAGISYEGLLQDMTESEINAVLARDLNSVIYSCKFASAHMVPRHCGNIINISSVWGVAGASCEAVYSAAKGAVITFTKAMAKELGPSGIRVNCVSPGVIKTKMLDCYTRQDLERLAEETPLGRIGTPADVAAAVNFLAGDGAGFITGHNLVVDGGFVL